MDLNQPFDFNPSSTSSSQMQNSVPMSPFMLPLNHPLKEVNEELSRSQLLIQKRNIELFWQQQMAEIRNTTAFRGQQQLPLARVKKIMRSDQDVKMISAETPVLFSKACEIFIQELTLRAWMQTEQCRRRTMQRCDVARAIRQKETMDFLIDMVPLNHPKDHHGNFPQPSEFQPGNQMQFPILDMNAQLNPEVEQQLMTQPPMPFGDFNMGLPPSE